MTEPVHSQRRNRISEISVDEIEVGDRIRFIPDSRQRAWWTVADRNTSHVVAIRQAPFHAKGTVEYTVTGIQNPEAGSTLVRSSLNTLGGGWDLSNREGGAGAAEILEALESHKYELSHRRMVEVDRIERYNTRKNPSAAKRLAP